MARKPTPNEGAALPDPTPDPDLVTQSCVRVYTLERDLRTGCWQERYFNVPESALKAGFVRDGEVRHITGCLAEIEKDARSRG